MKLVKEVMTVMLSECELISVPEVWKNVKEDLWSRVDFPYCPVCRDVFCRYELPEDL